MLKGFKDFIMRGNLVEVAVAFIMATAFATVVTAFVGFIMSIVSKVAGGPPNLDDMPPAAFSSARCSPRSSRSW
jgi:large conductance mechanosensitive channel